MDLVADCKLKLAKFRFKELKDLLSLLGLAKHGRKKDIVARITDLLTSEEASSSASTSALSEIVKTEEVAKIIHDVHRNMVAEMYESARGGKTRCPCGSPSPAVYMVECKNPDCRVLQHKFCVRGLHAVPPHFNCEICRINRADLSWVGTKNLLHPTRLDLSETRVDERNNAVNLNTEFQIQGRDLNPTDCEGYEVQCKNPDCRVLQHKVCVRGLHAVPPHFNCEICRINRADLSWVGTKNLLHPTRLDLSETRVDERNNAVNLNTEFQIQGRNLDPTDCEGYEVQCKNPDCRVLQHKICVRGLHAVPPHFNCEICRINRADLSWVGMKNLLHPTRLDLSETLVDVRNNAVNLNTKFQIQGRDLDPTDCEGYEVQVWCILLNDAAHFRMHWPKCSELEVNGKKVKTVDRNEYQVLGTNGRDSGALILRHLKEGLNKISFSAQERRIFCLGVRLVKLRTIQEVCKLIPKEQEGEPLNDAKARVIRCVGGGSASHDNASRDLEVLSDSVVDLRCPSECPICLKNYPWEDIIIDPYFNQVIRTIEQSGADTTEIKIRSDGSWFAHHGPTTSQRMQCDLSSPSRTTNNGASLEDPMIISDSE